MNVQNLLSILSIRYKLNTYTRGITKPGEKKGTYDILELSTAGYKKADKKLEQSLLDMFNFMDWKDANITVGRNSIIVGNVEYFPEQIPSIPLERCNYIKAENNVVDIQEGKYYQFKDSDGNVHKLACANSHLSGPYSETKRGAFDNTSTDLGFFWNLLSKDATYISLYFSEDEIKGNLEQAGITEGFFTVKVGERQQDYFYTKREGFGTAILRSRYDVDYNAIINGELFRYYKPGSVFEIGGEKYVLKEDCSLDIPYGADIYDIKYPPKSDQK